MELGHYLKILNNLSKTYKIDKPYLVGGIPRDIYLKIPNIKTTDIDITTNSNDSLRLGILFADKVNEIFDLSDDGHITVFSHHYDFDFSSHFVSNKVIEYLNGRYKGLEEAFSRDFTINTLHQDIISGKIIDPTEQGFDDIKNKLIRTPVPASITLTDDPRRIYRAINLAARYDFDLDSQIIDFARNNPDVFTSASIKDKYAVTKLNKALIENEEKTLELLRQMDLFKKVPLSGRFKDLLISKKYLAEYLQNTSDD